MKNALLVLVFVQSSVLNADYFDSGNAAIQSDYRSACKEHVDGNAAIYFDGDVCSCALAGKEINPFSAADVRTCKDHFEKKQQCLDAGKDLTRYLANEEVSMPYGRCLCVATGLFMDAFHEDYFDSSKAGDKIERALKACAESRKKLSSRSSFEIAQMLNHYLHGLPKGVEPLVDTTSLKSIFEFLHPANASRSVKVVGKKTGKHGGLVLVYRKKFGHDEWMEASDPVGQQFDPRGSVAALGPVIGKFFGFEKIDEHTYTVPSLDEFNRAVDAINRGGQVVRGKGYQVVGQFGTAEYLQRAEENGSLPASEFLPNGDQTYFFHDVTLHLASSVIFPQELHLGLQKKLKELRRVMEESIEAIDAPTGMKKQMTSAGREYLAGFVDGLSVVPVFAKAASLFFGEIGSGGGAYEFDFFQELFRVVLHAGPADLRLSQQGYYADRFEALARTKRSETVPELKAMIVRLKDMGVNMTSVRDQAKFLMHEQKDKVEQAIFNFNEQCPSLR